jgi:hypothetical protein
LLKGDATHPIDTTGSLRPRAGLFLLLCALFAATAGLATFGAPLDEEADAPAILTFSKTLKGSVPEYLQITVDSNGSGAYEGRKLDDPPHPRPFQLSPALARQLFALAAQLGYFRSIELESHRKVANLGLKTLTYQERGRVGRVEFNYTQNRFAQELLGLLEKIANVEQHVASLEYSLKYDPLNLPKELLGIQAELDNKDLVAPELMVPTLERIIQNPRVLHLAQTRAENILQRIQTSN